MRPRTTPRINLLTATVQNEIISNNYVTALYMLYCGIWWSSKLLRYKFKEVNKIFWVLMILLGLYRSIQPGIWWSSYRGIKLREVNKWFWALIILLGLYRGIRWSSYRGMEEANKWFWVMILLWRLCTFTVLELNRSPIVTARYTTSTAHSLLCVHKADAWQTRDVEPTLVYVGPPSATLAQH